jgi:dTDP-4-dehydrorhamnose 3,5-epimerase
MKFLPCRLAGAFVVEIEPHQDARGLFARTFCQDEFVRHGLPGQFVQCNISRNRLRGTLRGMHYQIEPAPEGKLVRCTRGSIYDVLVDLRTDSPTYTQWEAFDLSAQTARAVFIPPGIAHGFQTLEDDTEVFYQMTEFYQPDLQRGVRWDDPAFRIRWPLETVAVSERDNSYPDFCG